MSFLVRLLRHTTLTLAAASLAAITLPASPARAEKVERPALQTSAVRTLSQGWMSPDVSAAWAQGFKGQGTTITVIDQFSTGQRISGNLGTGQGSRRHGEWTRMQAGMVAPSARMVTHDFSNARAVALSAGLNTLNLSYGMFAQSGLSANQIGWSPRESSIIQYANLGTAIVVKAAGNDAVAVNTANSAGYVDYLNTALTGKSGTIFVGALSTNGTTANKASLAQYSNFAGTDTTVQRQFLAVGVESHRTGLAGTSFAAPIVSGYAAILGSKFKTATPTQITNQLLSTARTDTIRGYSAALHGRGEASLSRALAPVAIR